MTFPWGLVVSDRWKNRRKKATYIVQFVYDMFRVGTGL